MKKLFFALAAVLFAACATDVTEDVAIGTPETIEVSFEEHSRIQLQNSKTVWTEGDLVSVFYRSDANQKWQFQGNTGDRSGILTYVSESKATTTLPNVVVVYPYNENYYVNPNSCNVQAFMPAVQEYKKDSYGLGSSLLVSLSEYNQVYLRNVCGWVKLMLTGDGEIVKSITFKGNNGEQVAGEIYINSSNATSILASDMSEKDNGYVGGALTFDNTVLTEVTLDCGEGVELSKEPTAFYIALPPQKFDNGISINALCADGSVITKSTDKPVAIYRNTIQPIGSTGGVTQPEQPILPTPAKNEIYYTTKNGEKLFPNDDSAKIFGAILISNIYKDGYGVLTFDDTLTFIGRDAFRECSTLTSIAIPNGVTSIRELAFDDCESLTSVTIPDSVTSIGNWAFDDCSSLKSITIPDSVTSIGEWTFSSCGGLTSVTIPDSVISIGDNAFSYCSNLKSVIIGNSVTSTGDYAFQYCYSLTSVTIGNSVTKIGDYAFRNCSSLTSVTIPDSVTSIGSEAFYGCSGLTSITIPDSVTSIGNDTFQKCSSLKSIIIPDSVTSIGDSAFKSCSSLTAFYGKFASVDNRCLIIDGVLRFFAPKGLTEYTIPDSVTEIGKYAFDSCSSLTSITIPDSVISIGSYAFCKCSSLTSITIPNSVTEIGERTFYYCSSLTSVTIGNSVTSIGTYAFEYCSSLKEVYCKPTTPPSGGSSMFSFNASGRKIYVPRASVYAYKHASYWSSYASDIVGYNF